MKNINTYLGLLIGMFFSAAGLAQPISMSTAIAIAEIFANNNMHTQSPALRSTYSKQVEFVETMNLNGRTLLYLANMQDSGFVLIPNELRCPPVLGYSDSGRLTTDTTNMPPALVFLLNEYMTGIDSIASTSVVNNPANPKWSSMLNSANTPTPMATPNFVRPLLCDEKGYQLEWGQSGNNYKSALTEKSYNKFCPSLPSVANNRALVGCGPVAMAQVMRYWRWPDHATVKGITYHYDWENMPYKISNSTDVYQVDMIAMLMRNSGEAADAVYMSSGTLIAIEWGRNALKNTFGYVHAESKWRVFFNKNNWRNLMIDELNVSRPVLYQAWKSISSAHIFVVDGYDSNGLFHINFGWSGYNGSSNGGGHNGYWNLDDFNGYNSACVLLTGLYPDCSKRTNVSGVSYTSVSSGEYRQEYATNTITVCNNGQNLAVNGGGKLDLVAGTGIVLCPGFHAKPESKLRVYIKNFSCNGTTFSTRSGLSLSPLSPMDEVLEKINEKSMDQQMLLPTVTIYPNPTDGNFTVQIIGKEQDYVLEIFNSLGMYISKIESDRSNKHHINRPDLPKGTYYIRITMENGQVTKKVVIQK